MDELRKAVLRLHPDLRDKAPFWKRRTSVLKVGPGYVLGGVYQAGCCGRVYNWKLQAAQPSLNPNIDTCPLPTQSSCPLPARAGPHAAAGAPVTGGGAGGAAEGP